MTREQFLQGGKVSSDFYPSFICCVCGNKYGRHNVGIATFHEGNCDICGKLAAVTEPRDYGHLKANWVEGVVDDRA